MSGLRPLYRGFPLPLADFGIFKGGTSRLSKRRWLTVIRKRLLHIIIIVALNYLHDGFRGGGFLGGDRMQFKGPYTEGSGRSLLRVILLAKFP